MNLIHFSDESDEDSDADDDESVTDELTVLTAIQNEEDGELVFILFFYILKKKNSFIPNLKVLKWINNNFAYSSFLIFNLKFT